MKTAFKSIQQGLKEAIVHAQSRGIKPNGLKAHTSKEASATSPSSRMSVKQAKNAASKKR